MISQKAKKAICLGSLCSISYLAVYIARNILGAVTPQMIEVGYSESFIGTISSVYFVCYALVNGYVVADFRGFADNYSCTVVNKDSFSYCCSWVNFYTRKSFCSLRKNSCKQAEVVFMQRMSHTIVKQCFYTAVGKENFNFAFCSRVFFKGDCNVGF